MLNKLQCKYFCQCTLLPLIRRNARRRESCVDTGAAEGNCCVQLVHQSALRSVGRNGFTCPESRDSFKGIEAGNSEPAKMMGESGHSSSEDLATRKFWFQTVRKITRYFTCRVNLPQGVNHIRNSVSLRLM